MTDYFPDRTPEESIEETRRKKLEQFRRTYDQDAIRGAYDVDEDNFVLDNPVPPYEDDAVYASDEYDPADTGAGASSAVSFSTDDTPLKHRKKSNEINSFSDSDTKKRIERDSKKALKRQKKEEKRNEKVKARRNRRIFLWVWLAMIAMVSVMIAQFVIIGVNDMLAVGREENVRTVQISVPADYSIDSIADILYDNGVIARPTFFKLYARLTSSESGFRQGEFMLNTNKDYEAIINTLQSNESRTDFEIVQITEGMSVWEIAILLRDSKVITDVNKFLELCNSNEFDEEFTFLKGIPTSATRMIELKDEKGNTYRLPDSYKLEGYLFPDTYYFYKGDDEKNLKSIISKMLDNYENKIIYHKEKYFADSKRITLLKEAENSGYDIREILTIASIIQAEAATKEDMRIISRILHNRLTYDASYGVKKLNCDSTVYYPWREKEDVPEEIRETYTSRYDTFNFEGLPEGPICNPGVEAIKAAIRPSTDAKYINCLYFCHIMTENGLESRYAETLEQHNQNLSEDIG